MRRNEAPTAIHPFERVSDTTAAVARDWVRQNEAPVVISPAEPALNVAVAAAADRG
jgi:hypothetical protein